MNNQLNEQQIKVQRRSRTSLVILLAIFLVPIFLAYVVHKNPSLQPGSTKNNGILFKPVVTLTDFTFKTRSGTHFTIDQLRGKWALVYIGGAECSSLCQETLLKARNGIIAQGAEGTRIRYFYISTDKQLNETGLIKKEHPGMVILSSVDDKSRNIFSQFSIGNEHQVGKDDRLYLVDPAGNILMHYPAGFKDIGLMEDLKHLLKWSQIG